MKKRLFLGTLFSFCVIAGQMAYADDSKEHPRWGKCFHETHCYDKHDSDRKQILEGCSAGDKNCYKMQESLLAFISKNTENAAVNSEEPEEQLKYTQSLKEIVGLIIQHKRDPQRSQEMVTKVLKKEVEGQEKNNPEFTKQFTSCYR